MSQAAQSGSQFLVPLRIVVSNVGGAPADGFDVSVAIEGTDVTGSLSVTGPLAAGGEVAFEEVAYIPGELAGQTIRLAVEADGCGKGEVNNESHCRVLESNEGNNVAILSVALPVSRVTETSTPTATPTATVAPDQAPLVTITAPADGSRFEYSESAGIWYVAIELEATADDAKDGPLGNEFLSWTTDRGSIDPGNSIGGFVTASLYFETDAPCLVTTHTVELTGRDSAGNIRTDTIRIDTGDFCIG